MENSHTLDQSVLINSASAAALQERLNSPEITALFEANMKFIKEQFPERPDMAKHLGIEFTKVQPGYLEATMPVDPRTSRFCMPVNILCGGASLALAENMAGFGSMVLCKPHHNPCGIQVSANHLRILPEGHTVRAVGKIVHFGSTIHIWDILILDEQDREISSIRITNMILTDKPQA